MLNTTPYDNGHEFKKISNSWLEINLTQFADNIDMFKSQLKPGTRMCAVMKADAYGNGISGLIGTVMEQGVDCVAIASNEEARIVRDAGYNGQLFRVRTASANEVKNALQYDIEEMVGSLKHAKHLARIAEKNGQELRVHLVINAGGMGRNGVEIKTEAGMNEAVRIAQVPNLKIVGIMTHFPNEDRDEILPKAANFEKGSLEIIKRAHLNRDEITLHAANSFTSLNVPEAQFDMVRPGGVLYGDIASNPEYKSIVSFKTRVASLQKLPAGSTVGYGSTVTLLRDSVLANLPMGYSDGYPRRMGNKADVLVKGQRAHVMGMTSMNTTMIDVTDINGVREQNEVVLFGEQEGARIKASEMEEYSGLIFPEMYTIWGATNPRVYVR
ncbi:alanine racemase [Shewanella sp. NFH-SH190041]|nr:alanine racemase [Shewanella sp. NFH-SH190041]